MTLFVKAASTFGLCVFVALQELQLVHLQVVGCTTYDVHGT